MMKTTLSIIKADIGSIGGHIRPSERLIAEVRNYVGAKGKGFITDFFISHTGDDIAILFSHSLGKGSEKVHQLAWDAFVAGTKVAKEQGLYGAAMLPYSELEYGGIVDKMKKLDGRFKVR
jgi:fructose 1,6-bisphosphate aldolase/phosphatase